jgi:hypothetical protein
MDVNTEQDIELASEVRNRIRADRRLQMTQVQVRASHGMVTLSGEVASDAERVAAAQDAARIPGIEALVNTLHVPTNPDRLNNIPQKVSAIVPLAGRALVEGSHSTDSAISGAGSSSSASSFSGTKTFPQAPQQITVPRGTLIVVRLAETLSSGANQRGDTFLTRLASPIVNGDRVIVPDGAVVEGEVVDVRKARRPSGMSTLIVKLTRLNYNDRSYELSSSPYSQVGAPRNAYAAAATTGGTGVGAILGTVIGRRRGAAVGSFLGGAAGAGVQAVTKPAAAELPAEFTLSLRLESPLNITPLSSTPRAQNAGQRSTQDQLYDRPVLKERLDSAPVENTSRSSQTSDSRSEQSSRPAPRHD